MSLTKFNSVIKTKRNVYNKIGGADLVVIYCKQASDRSPTIMALYQDAVSNVATRPEIYNPNQTVLLLAGGIKAYTEDVSDGPPYRKLLTVELILCVANT